MSSVPRFFVSKTLLQGDSAVLPSEAAHHARTVLRMRPGEALTLHDGENRAYDAVVTEIARDNVTVALQSVRELETEPKIRVMVGQALPKTLDKAEQVLQHGTEIGAAGFLLFQAERSVARMEGRDKVEKRVVRWRGILQGAAEQSGRGVLPSVEWASSSKDAAKTCGQYDAVLILHESAATPLRHALASFPTNAANLLILVGPEGGFTDTEISLFKNVGATPISLGPRILRTETAALAALSQILFYFEP